MAEKLGLDATSYKSKYSAKRDIDYGDMEMEQK